ncbi:MAG: hypothetical protein NT013_23665 [Planctomycetia bacterium]|nr:hypothetical protein [Planctomycetia bacterium]
MPIKFRCQHCRQFLGISHLKAGLLVDCPTCGRTIRVPDPEGNVEPLPEPKLNLQDSRLANALNELAALGRGDSFEPESAVVVAEAENETPKPPTAATIPAPLAPPVPVAAPAPVRVEPPPPPKPVPVEAHDPNKLTPAATMQELAALANQSAPRDPAADQPFLEPMVHANGRTVPRSWGRNGVALSWVITIAMVTFFVGFLAGRWDRTPNSNNVAVIGAANNAPPANAGVNVSAKNGSNGNGIASRKDQPTSSSNTPAVRGRVTYQTDAGERRPDRGARVLLLPEKREGSAKLSVVGLRSADTDADVQIAATTLKAAGGEVAVVDELGNYEIGTLKPGTYRIVALSHFQPRDKRETLDGSLKGILDNFFDRSEQLLGKCRYHVGQLKYSGKETELWDHQFERE